MPKEISKKELKIITDAVAQFPQGCSFDEIYQLLKSSVTERTLRRHIALLVEQQQLSVIGQHKNRRYQLLSATTEQKQIDNEPAIISLSHEAEMIKQTVSAPIQLRKPVAYQRDFLDAYQPNKTFYLPETVRLHLQKIGRIPDIDHQAGTYAKKILHKLLIDLSWNSSRLEGNTYSLLETQDLIESGKIPNNKDASETQMILNHKEAIEFLVLQADLVGFNRYTILNVHGLLSHNLLGNPQASGNLRKIMVGIGKTVYHPPAIPMLIEEIFLQILDTATAIQDPFEQAFFALVHLPYLQPFEDVNKRVSRISANIPFIKQNLTPLSFIDVPTKLYIDGLLGVYELNRYELLRDVFVWAYERSAQRYAVIQQTLSQPDLLKLRYHHHLKSLINDIVIKKMNKQQAIQFIKQVAATQIQEPDRARFIEAVEIELMSLHEGNIARFRVNPVQFEAWKKVWGP